MKIFYFVVIKTYCLRSHKGHILFNKVASHFVGLCALVLDPTHLRGGQLHGSVFLAGLLGTAALPATPVPSAGRLHAALDSGGSQNILCLPVSETTLLPLPSFDGQIPTHTSSLSL